MGSDKDGAAEAMFGLHMHPLGFGPISQAARVNDCVGDVFQEWCLVGGQQ